MRSIDSLRLAAQTTNRMRQHQALQDIPVIMLTSMGGRDDIVRSLGLGVDGYLTKPARPSVLVDAVHAVLAR